MAVDFVRAVHVDIERVHFVAVEHVDAEAFQLGGGGVGLDTAPSIWCLMEPSASIKWAAVEPVPTPTMVPGVTYSSAAQPTAFQFILRHNMSLASVRKRVRIIG